MSLYTRLIYVISKRHFAALLTAVTLLSLDHASAQGLNGLMRADPVVESPNTIVRDARSSVLIVNSEIQGLRFDSNVGIGKIEKIGSSQWEITVTAGTHLFTITCPNYQNLELERMSLSPKRAYEVRIRELRAPRIEGIGSGSGSLEIFSDPAGARVEFPDLEGFTGTTPARWGRIPSNKYAIRIIKEMYDTLETEVIVYKDTPNRSAVFKLVPQFGYALIRPSVPANLIIDGMSRGQVVSQLVQLPRGDHQISFTKNRYETYEEFISIGPGDTVLVAPRLRSNFGYVSVRANIEADLFVNTLFKGRIRTAVIELEKGQHWLEFKQARYSTFERAVSIGSGDTVVIEPVLKPTFANVRFAGMRVMSLQINGVSTAIAPLVEVTAGQNSFDLIIDGVGRRSKSFLIPPGETRLLQLDDFQDPGVITVRSDIPASVYVNDTLVGTSGVVATLYPKEYNVRVEHPMLGSVSRNIMLAPNQNLILTFNLRPSRAASYWLSPIPSASQFYKGQEIRGSFYLLTMLVSVGGAAFYYHDADVRTNQYNFAIQRYQNATAYPDIADLRSYIEKSHKPLSDAFKYRNIAAIAAGSVLFVSMLDAFIFSPEYGYAGDAVPQPSSAAIIHPVTGGVAITYTARF